MSDMNQELTRLSKNLAGMTVARVLKKHDIAGDQASLVELSEEQKQELRDIAKNLESIVNDYVSQNDEITNNIAEELQTVESPLRKLMKKTNEREDENNG
ncbi:hypothetical protein [Tenuibacillus multivorans]|uniref:hypothetical protein n=1 Tax=Tenuibacillus multivorans TaxID=237069 RepID=UPI000B852317|nr:hypothetical protein [Tenuibacillus multivorans]GEL78798.1 hypothetical protein TMU01_30330 [Tenuibacillus multivorans]